MHVEGVAGDAEVEAVRGAQPSITLRFTTMGRRERDIDLRRSDEGWSLLGTYLFSEDTVQVVLSNDCGLQSVTADAVRIVRR